MSEYVQMMGMEEEIGQVRAVASGLCQRVGIKQKRLQ